MNVHNKAKVFPLASPCGPQNSFCAGESMLDFLRTWPAQLVIGVTILAVLSVVGWYVVAKFRDSTGDDGLSASELLSNFREIHQQGDIDESEYRKIKTALGAKLQQEEKAKKDQG